MKKILAWHFAKNDLKLAHAGGSGLTAARAAAIKLHANELERRMLKLFKKGEQ
jgi:hypothetical protein